MPEFKGIDFALLTDPQLLKLLRLVEVEIAKRRAQGRRLALTSSRIREGEGPKYRNPDNPSETWSGRGRRPSWVDEAIARGMLMSDLEFDDNRPVAHPEPPPRRRKRRR